MSRRAAIAGAALGLGAFPLLAEPGSAATVEIPSPLDPECCSISDGSMLQSDPAGGRERSTKSGATDPRYRRQGPARCVRAQGERRIWREFSTP